MVSESHWVFVQFAQGIRAGVVDDGAVRWSDAYWNTATSDEASLSAFADALEVAGYRGQGATLAIRSDQCVAASFPALARGARGRGAALLFALEEHVPLAAEEMVADFFHSGPHVIGVAVDRKIIFSLLERLQQAGVIVESIAPIALLALGQFQTTQVGDDPRLILWHSEERIDLLLVTSRQLEIWRTLPAEADLLETELRQLQHVHKLPTSMLAYDLSGELLDGIRRVHDEIDVDQQASSLTDAAAFHAARRHSGDAATGIELARGPLGRRDPLGPLRGPIRATAFAAALLLILFSAACLWRAGRYESLAEQCSDQKKDLFRQTLPGKRVPQGVLRRLEREYQRLAGLTGRSADLPRTESALVSLRDALLALPPTMRFRLLDVRVDGDRLTLDAEVRGHGDADRLAGGLRNHGFIVMPPHTEQISHRSVSVRLDASRIGDKAIGGGKP